MEDSVGLIGSVIIISVVWCSILFGQIAPVAPKATRDPCSHSDCSDYSSCFKTTAVGLESSAWTRTL